MRKIGSDCARAILEAHGKKVKNMILVASSRAGLVKTRIRMGDIVLERVQEGHKGYVSYYIGKVENEQLPKRSDRKSTSKFPRLPRRQ
jgi:hypothetical protein